MLMLSLLGGLSLQIIRMTGRLPVGVPRLVLFSTPFLGLIFLTLSIGRSQDFASWIGDLGLFMMTMPGPIYIHLSWAPRWRMFEMLEAGEDPFKQAGIKTEAELINEVDSGKLGRGGHPVVHWDITEAGRMWRSDIGRFIQFGERLGYYPSAFFYLPSDAH